MIRAIDVSRWQGVIDWRAVKGDGVPAAWIKVGGADGGFYRDSRAGANLVGAADADVEYGTYYFFVPGADAVGQARHAVSCGHGRGRLLPAIDVETNPHGLGRREIDRDVSLFCAEVMRLTGRESIVYTYSAAGLVGYTEAAPAHCRLWVANYGSNQPSTTPPRFNPRVPPAWSTWDVWQFNSRTRVAGIVGNTVDQNVITDEFWLSMVAPGLPLPPLKEGDMYHIITQNRPDHPTPGVHGSTWILCGLDKVWLPTIGYADAFKAAAERDPKNFVDHGWVAVDGPDAHWIAMLDLAEQIGPGPADRNS